MKVILIEDESNEVPRVVSVSSVSVSEVTIINQIIGSVISQAAYRVYTVLLLLLLRRKVCPHLYSGPRCATFEPSATGGRARARAAAGSIKAARRLGAKRQVTQVNTAAPDTQALICR